MSTVEYNYDVDATISARENYNNAIEEKRKSWNRYHYTKDNTGKLVIESKVGVPRVTEILDACIGKSYLQTWAASLGADYEEERKKILNTGTYTHLMIEDFLTYGYIRESNKTFNKPHYPEQAAQCYYNFVAWYHSMLEQNFKIDVIDIEKEVVCPMYGGTIDCIAKIKDPTGLVGNYILDFKTSKSISIDYFYQTVMYMKAIEYENETSSNPLVIDGVGVIRFDKFKNTYEYLIINKYKDPEFISSLELAVDNIIHWYYLNIYASYEYKLIRKKYMKGDRWV